MGLYTEIHFNSKLKDDIPQEIIDVLQYMVGNKEKKPETLPSHILFETSRWHFMLRCGSIYFDADTHSTLRFDEISNSYYLCIRSNVKNYANEIEHFVDWIHPYLDKFKDDFLGFSRVETTERPTLLYA